jgi:anti-sigma-K factor RskA
MDYGRYELADRLAAEYVLGTLRGPARRRLETLLPAHPMLAAAVRRWEERLLPLAEHIPQHMPRPEVWKRVQQRLAAEEARLAGAGPAPAPEPALQPVAEPVHQVGRAQPAANTAWWQRLGLWQGATAAGFIATVVATLVLGTPQPQQPPLVIVLQANPDAAGTMNASFVASLASDGRSLVLRPVNVPAIEATRAFELWAVPAQGAPRSLGLVSASQGATLQRANLLQDTAAFAVSLEPAGGSPTGAPTGPIVSLGKLQL